jgi:CheY-like chemotaxis protein
MDHRPSVLIVDDDKAYSRLLCTLLGRQGYEVRSALCAGDALEVLKTFRPQLILMDIQLPGMDGLELTRMLKTNTDTREMTVVAFSGSPVPKQIALDAGCEGYIAKPIDPRRLIQLIAEYLQPMVL